MDTEQVVIVLIFPTALAFAGIVAWMCYVSYTRITKVSAFRERLLRLVTDAARRDILADPTNVEYTWRFNALGSVPFRLMCDKWWRPLTIEEWWDDDSFTK